MLGDVPGIFEADSVVFGDGVDDVEALVFVGFIGITVFAVILFLHFWNFRGKLILSGV